MSSLPLAALFAALIDAALKGSLILLAALGATRLMRRRSAAARHLVWVVALASMLALPLVTRMLPGWRALPVPAPLLPAASFVAEPESPAPPTVAPREAASPRVPAEVPAPAPATHASAATAPAPVAFDWKTALMALWVVGGALLVIRLVYGMMRVWWMERRAVEITDEGWVRITDALARRLRVGRMVTLLREDHAVVPMTWGIVRPVVLLPTEAEAWDSERRTVVLAHELAHVRRWDTATQWIAHVALALFWFNPLVWVAARRLREEREHACDDAVLSIGTVPVHYADHLLDIVRSLGSAEGPAAALAMARRSQFEGRLLAILDGATPRGGVSRGLGFAALVMAAAAVLPLGALRAALPAAAPLAQEAATSTATPQQPVKPGKGPLAHAASKVELILNRVVGSLPLRDSGVVLTTLRGPAQPESPASAASAAGAASSPYASGVSTPPRPPMAPTPSSEKSSVAAVASALGVPAQQAAAMLQDSGGYGDIIRAASTITSPPDQAAVLLAVLRRGDVQPADLTALYRVAGTIASDPSRRDVLKEGAERYPLSNAVARRAFFAATAAFVSAPERRDVLLAVLERSGDADAVSGTILSARAMASEAERRDVYLKVADRAAMADLQIELVNAARELTSSPVRRDVLVKLLSRPGLSTAVLRSVLGAVAEMVASPEKRDVLVYAAGHQRIDAAARDAYLTAAGTIVSSPERTEAIQALLGGRAATNR